MSIGIYETWVRTLRELQKNPAADTRHLPSIEETTFTPSTLKRLIRHIERTFDAMREQWHQNFIENLSTAKDVSSQALALNNGRAALRFQVNLAHHPSLPPVLRKAFIAQTEEYVRELQRQLLEDGSKVHEEKLDYIGRDEWVRLVKENPLTTVLAQQST